MRTEYPLFVRKTASLFTLAKALLLCEGQRTVRLHTAVLGVLVVASPYDGNLFCLVYSLLTALRLGRILSRKRDPNAGYFIHDLIRRCYSWTDVMITTEGLA
jgi:hypothetical protein